MDGFPEREICPLAFFFCDRLSGVPGRELLLMEKHAEITSILWHIWYNGER